MATLDELHERLRVAAMLLDASAGDIRDVPLAPSRENIRHVGQALAAIFDLMRAIHAVRPDLAPPAIEESPLVRDANIRLTSALGQALELTERGELAPAIQLLSAYAAAETSALHRRIAEQYLGQFSGTET